MNKVLVSIIMGSDSDLPVMKAACEILQEFKVPFEVKIVSAHRTTNWMMNYCAQLPDSSTQVVIAGAGGAAHLPGMVASNTSLPVIGVPIKSSNSIDGWDSILSILQMPNGIPVATVALNAAKNAGLLAIRILAAHDTGIRSRMNAYREAMSEEVLRKNKKLEASGFDNYIK
jgi:5-(carboxyamino)imidazole ribonucleotide mutase